MLIFIILFAPAIIAMLLYEKLNPGDRTIFRFIVITICFAFFINLLAYVTLLLRGHTYIVLSYYDTLASVIFSIKYMLITMGFACLLAILAAGLSKIKIRKKNG